MGTHIWGFVDCRLADDVRREPARVLEALEPALAACKLVKEYWRERDPDHQARDSWELYERIGETSTCYGPGSMGIDVGARMAKLGALARWRGFLSIPELRVVHRQAFSAIARCVGGTRILYVPDYCHQILEEFVAGKSLDDCAKLMGELWGPAQSGGLDDIDPTIVAECDRNPPSVWYLDEIALDH